MLSFCEGDTSLIEKASSGRVQGEKLDALPRYRSTESDRWHEFGVTQINECTPCSQCHYSGYMFSTPCFTVETTKNRPQFSHLPILMSETEYNVLTENQKKIIKLMEYLFLL